MAFEFSLNGEIADLEDRRIKRFVVRFELLRTEWDVGLIRLKFGERQDSWKRSESC